ncbi:hypothetical protein CF319_g5177 [Tilletia indica]|uniref:Uncharacterized protein n=1 Tax=Tilletia indica TaxID=43049 RepID=A0A177TQ18_9BASI|nr:hypothetical protein CF319_g5177 [Tilletia indica]KAE8231002.1 hypothetical protein CF326_g3990 [Tilletia indica]KAE8244839.1 hypothetical protein A4X13_0g6209 [Tilletia indica]
MSAATSGSIASGAFGFAGLSSSSSSSAGLGTTPPSAGFPPQPSASSIPSGAGAGPSFSAAFHPPSGSVSGPSSSAPTAPPSVRSAAGSPRPKFETETLSTYLRTHLSTRLQGVSWNRDKEKTRSLTSELAQSAKAKMLEIAPRGFKFVVNVQLVENLGQGGRGDLACHWEESDQVVQELFSNDRILCTVTCFAIRAF